MNVVAVIVRKLNLLSLMIELLDAVVDDVLWCTLHINSNSIFLIWMLNGSDHALSDGRERYTSKNTVQFPLNDLMHWHLSILQESD